MNLFVYEKSRDRPAQRPLRHPVARRLHVRRPLRPLPARHKPRAGHRLRAGPAPGQPPGPRPPAHQVTALGEVCRNEWGRIEVKFCEKCVLPVR